MYYIFMLNITGKTRSERNGDTSSLQDGVPSWVQDDAGRFRTSERTGRALAMLTDGELCCQQAKIAALGLNRSDIMPIICTGQWGRSYWKPHRRGFEDIQSHYRLPPSAFVYIADNPVKDFIAPRALGWRTVQIIRPGGIHSAYRSEEHTSELQSLMRISYAVF